MKRAQNKIRRVLMLVDALAPLRMPFTAQEAKRLLEERSGDKVEVCERTIRRDLELLESMNFVYIHRHAAPRKWGQGTDPAQYKMNLRLTTSAETAAIKVEDAKP